MAQLEEDLPNVPTAPSSNLQYRINQKWVCVDAISLRKKEQEDQKLKVILSCLASLKPTWNIPESLFIKQGTTD